MTHPRIETVALLGAILVSCALGGAIAIPESSFVAGVLGALAVLCTATGTHALVHIVLERRRPPRVNVRLDAVHRNPIRDMPRRKARVVGIITPAGGQRTDGAPSDFDGAA